VAQAGSLVQVSLVSSMMHHMRDRTLESC
jgi:hypothetical protein